MSTTHETVARLLREAYCGGAIAPLRDYLEPTDAAGAYAVQAINTRFWEAQGRRIVGRKAGLTAGAVQKQLGVAQPDFGALFDDMRVAMAARSILRTACNPRRRQRSPSCSAPICLRPALRWKRSPPPPPTGWAGTTAATSTR